MFRPEKVFLDFEASKVRWLSNSKIMPTSLFCLGSCENERKVSVWQTTSNDAQFEPILLAESGTLDGRVTELKAINSEEVLASTTNGSIYLFRLDSATTSLNQIKRWTINKNQQVDNDDDEDEDDESSAAVPPSMTSPIVTSFDCNADFDEICSVNESGVVSFVRMARSSGGPSSAGTIASAVQFFKYKELCALNSVLYLKQFEIAIADSLGRVKIWDTRNKDQNRSAMTLLLDGESSSIQCLANHPNQQHIIACGNLNGFIFIYDVRNQKKPFIMSHAYSEPVIEVCFHPLSIDNLLSCSFNGSLRYWNVTSRNEFSGWDDRSVNSENLLPENKYPINSFDINAENVLAVNANYNLIKVKNHNLI